MDDYKFTKDLVSIVCSSTKCSSCPFAKYIYSDEYSCSVFFGIRIDPKDIPLALKLLIAKMGENDKDKNRVLKMFFRAHKDEIQKYWCDIV